MQTTSKRALFVCLYLCVRRFSHTEKWDSCSGRISPIFCNLCSVERYFTDQLATERKADL